MKNAHATWVVMLLLAASGCGEGSPMDPQETDLITAETVDPSGLLPEVVLGGDVVLLLGEHRPDLIVALDGGAGRGQDGTADQVFRLQRSREGFWPQFSESPSATALPNGAQYLRNASLRYDGRSLQITHPDYSAILTVDGDIPPTEASGARWNGYGLARAVGQWPMNAASLAAIAVTGFTCNTSLLSKNAFGTAATRDSYTAMSDDECASGGAGATSCSLSVGGFECSVSCGEGFYACCNLMGGCKCVGKAAD